MAVNFKNIMQSVLLLLLLSPFFLDTLADALPVTTSSSNDRNRSKREIYFRPLFVYKQQQRDRQRLQKIQALYLQQQNSLQQHLPEQPSVPINYVYYTQTLPLQQQLSYQQQYEQQYYQQYYDKYFQTFPKNSLNVL